MPNYEFHDIFDRTTNYVDLKGKFTVLEIEKALLQTREYCRRRYHNADTESERARFKMAKVRYDNLLQHGFARRTVREASFEPQGFIGMTLRFGKMEAKRRLDAQRRSRMRFYSRPRYWKRY